MADQIKAAPFGYAVEQPDGHVTFFKDDPKGFRAYPNCSPDKSWAELGVKVHDLFTKAAAPAVPAVDALPRFEPHEQMVGFMQDSGAGEYVRLGDVLALLATLSTVPDEQQKQDDSSHVLPPVAAPVSQHEASTPAYDLMDGLSKFVELAICELFDGKANKAIRSDLRRLAKDFQPAYWQVARIDAATGAARGRHACNKEVSDLAHPADAGAVGYRAKLYKLVWTYFNNDCGENVYNLMESARAHFALVGADVDATSEQDEPTDREALIASLEDDAAKLSDANPDDEMAQTMREAAAMLESGAQVAKAQQPALTVWEGAMPESNGKSNFTAVLMRKDAMWDGPHVTIERSEYPDRIRYEADRVRHLIGELDAEPFILDYDADKHSGYVAPAERAAEGEATSENADDIAVNKFAAAMKAKMYASYLKGRGGWDDPAQCTAESLQAMLLDHLAKGDPVDVGNFAMMLWNRGEPTRGYAVEAAPRGKASSDPEFWRRLREWESRAPSINAAEREAALVRYVDGLATESEGEATSERKPLTGDKVIELLLDGILIDSGAAMLRDGDQILFNFEELIDFANKAREQHHGIPGGGK